MADVRLDVWSRLLTNQPRGKFSGFCCKYPPAKAVPGNGFQKICSIMENNAQQRTMYFKTSVVFYESKLAKLVHEIADSGTGCADHLRQRLLTYLRDHRLRLTFLAEIRQ